MKAERSTFKAPKHGNPRSGLSKHERDSFVNASAFTQPYPGVSHGTAVNLVLPKAMPQAGTHNKQKNISFSNEYVGATTSRLKHELRYVDDGFSVVDEGSLDNLIAKYKLEEDKAYPHLVLSVAKLRFQEQHYTMSEGFPKSYFWIQQSLILGPDFANKYTKSVYYARMHALNGTPFALPEDALYSIKWSGTQSIFQPHDFPYWDEDVDDIEYMFTGQQKVNEDDLKLLYDATCSVVKEVMDGYGTPMPPPHSHLFTPGPGKAYVMEEKTVDSYIADTKPKYDYFGTTLLGKRVKIPKKPGETRDGVVLFPPSRRSLRKVNWYLAWVANKLDNCPYGKDMDYVSDLLDKFHLNKKYFYQRDIEKCGLTLPIEVVRTVNRAVFDMLGLQEEGDLADLLFRQPVLHDYSTGECVQRLPVRGHFLGMWSEGTTILQYAIHKMNPYSDKVMFSAINDDQLAGCRSGNTLECYAEADREQLARLFIPFKLKKTFISVGALLYLEETRGVHSEKHVIWEKSAFNALAAHSITQAKSYVNGLSYSAPELTNFTHPLRTLVLHFGYEFFEGEEVMPYMFGGWVTPVSWGCDASYDSYESLPTQIRAYWAIQKTAPHADKSTKMYPTTSWGREIQSALIKNEKPSDMIVSLVTTNGSMDALDSLYGDVFKTFSKTKRYYAALTKRRTKVYKSADAMEDIHPHWYARHPNSVIRFGCAAEGNPIDVAFTRTMDVSRAIDITYVLLNEMNVLRLSDKFLSSVKYSKKERWYIEKGYSPLIITGPGTTYWDRFHGIPEFFFKTGDFRPLLEAYMTQRKIITSHPESSINLDGMALCKYMPVSLGNALMLRETFSHMFIEELIAEMKEHFDKFMDNNSQYTISRYWRIVENAVDDAHNDDRASVCDEETFEESMLTPEVFNLFNDEMIEASDEEFRFTEEGWELPISMDIDSIATEDIFDGEIEEVGSEPSWTIDADPYSIADDPY